MKSHWCVPFTATFSKRRKIDATWSEHCDATLSVAESLVSDENVVDHNSNDNDDHDGNYDNDDTGDTGETDDADDSNDDDYNNNNNNNNNNDDDTKNNSSHAQAKMHCVLELL